MSAPHPRTLEEQARRIRRLLEEVGKAYREAHDAAYGSYVGTSVRQLGARGWVADPTGDAAGDRRRSALRGACKHAARRLFAAERELERAAAVLVDAWFAGEAFR